MYIGYFKIGMTVTHLIKVRAVFNNIFFTQMELHQYRRDEITTILMKDYENSFFFIILCTDESCTIRLGTFIWKVNRVCFTSSSKRTDSDESPTEGKPAFWR